MLNKLTLQIISQISNKIKKKAYICINKNKKNEKNRFNVGHTQLFRPTIV